MIHTRGSERLSVNQIYDFIKKVEKDFPTPISAKTDLMEYAKKCIAMLHYAQLKIMARSLQWQQGILKIQ